MASTDSVDEEVLELAAPAADSEAYLAAPVGLAERVKDLAAVPPMVVAMVALVRAHLLVAPTVSPT